MDKSPNRRPLTMRQFLTEVSGLVALGAAPTPGGARRRLREDDAVFGRLARGAEAGAAGDRGARRRGGEPGAGAGAAPAPAPEPAPAYAATPPPAAQTPAPTGPRRTHGAAIAATVVSLPAAQASRHGHADAGLQPEPVGADHAAARRRRRRHRRRWRPGPARPRRPSRPRAATSARRSGSRRATSIRWSPRRAQRVEAARAKGIAVPDPEAAVAAAVAAEVEAGPLDERYVDDGSVTTDDRKKFSLRSGATSTALADGGRRHPGRADERRGGHGARSAARSASSSSPSRWRWSALLGIVVWKQFKAKDVSKNAAALTPTEIPTQPPPPEVTPPPAPPAPPVAAVKPPAAAAAKDADEPTPKAARTPPAAKKHAPPRGRPRARRPTSRRAPGCGARSSSR